MRGCKIQEQKKKRKTTGDEKRDKIYRKLELERSFNRVKIDLVLCELCCIDSIWWRRKGWERERERKRERESETRFFFFFEEKRHAGYTWDYLAAAAGLACQLFISTNSRCAPPSLSSDPHDSFLRLDSTWLRFFFFFQPRRLCFLCFLLLLLLLFYFILFFFL